jgi:hypothetical protein
LAEIRLKTVECVQFHSRHRFWSNIIQVGQNSTHSWFFVHRFGQNSGSLEKLLPILVLFRPKSMAEIKLCGFDQNKILCVVVVETALLSDYARFQPVW